MVKMENHSKLEDSQISKLNDCLLVADRIWKVRRSSRQGFNKLNKLNPNGGGARSSVPIRNELSPFANGPLSLATPSEQSSREASPTQSIFSLENPLGKEEGKEIRAPDPDHTQQSGKMSSFNSSRPSVLGKERWRSSRRKPPTVTSGDQPPGHTGPSSSGCFRDGQPITPSSGKPQSIPFSPSFLGNSSRARGTRFGTGS